MPDPMQVGGPNGLESWTDHVIIRLVVSPLSVAALLPLVCPPLLLLSRRARAC